MLLDFLFLFLGEKQERQITKSPSLTTAGLDVTSTGVRGKNTKQSERRANENENKNQKSISLSLLEMYRSFVRTGAGTLFFAIAIARTHSHKDICWTVVSLTLPLSPCSLPTQKKRTIK